MRRLRDHPVDSYVGTMSCRDWYSQSTHRLARPADSANVDAIAEIAEETGAEVLRGALSYTSHSSAW